MAPTFNGGYEDEREEEREACAQWEHRDSLVMESRERIRRGLIRLERSALRVRRLTP